MNHASIAGFYSEFLETMITQIERVASDLLLFFVKKKMKEK
jgi:hypothetical protein